MKKFFILSATLFLLAAGCGKQGVQQRAPGTDDTNLEQSSNQPSTQAVSAPTSTPIGNKKNTKTLPRISLVHPGGLQGISVEQSVEGAYVTVAGSKFTNVSYTVDVGITALDLLKISYKVTAKDYGAGMGEFVETIDGIKPDSQHFWAFYVNGKSSNVGASSYKLEANDNIEWKLEAISSSGQ